MIRTVRNFLIKPGTPLGTMLLGTMMLGYALVSAVPVAAAPSRQANTGTITGQVLTQDNRPLPGVHLAALTQPPDAPNRTPISEFQSDSEGRYSVQVPAGQIWIRFETQDIAGQSFWGYDNLPVTIAAGQTVSGQDFRVAIRVVSEPTSVPPSVTPVIGVPPVTAPPGMPSTGFSSGLWLLPVAVLGASLFLFGVLLRFRVHS